MRQAKRTEMTPEFKAHLAKFIEDACKGTPLQHHSEFAGGYLAEILRGQFEYYEEIQSNLGSRYDK